MIGSNKQDPTFEEAVKAISKPDTSGFKPREEELKKTAKDDIEDRIQTIGFFRNQ